MDERDLDEQRRLRRAAVTRWGQVPEPDEGPIEGSAEGSAGGSVEEPAQEPVHEPAQEQEDERLAARRVEQQTLWVDLQVRRAMERGDFDNLPGAGKPLRLPDTHDPDWWVKRLIEREKLSNVAPPAIGLRREDAELDETLDAEATEEGVRRLVEDFNRRVVEARRQLQGGPPVITRTRDLDGEVERWRARRTARVEEARQRRAAADRDRDRERAEASRSARRNPLRRLVPRRRDR
jgi:DnaJ-like protein